LYDRIKGNEFIGADYTYDAAIFDLQLPLSGGVLLADEVGMGKTITDNPLFFL